MGSPEKSAARNARKREKNAARRALQIGTPERQPIGIEYAYREAGLSWEEIDAKKDLLKTDNPGRGYDPKLVRRDVELSLHERLDSVTDTVGPNAKITVRKEAPWHEKPYAGSDNFGKARPAETPEPQLPPRSKLLFEAEGLITGDRNASYGSPTENFQNTADLWTVQFKHMLKDGERFSAAQVAEAMMHLKLARLIASPKRDNFLDIAGYAACGWECAEDAQPKAESARRAVLMDGMEPGFLRKGDTE